MQIRLPPPSVLQDAHIHGSSMQVGPPPLPAMHYCLPALSVDPHNTDGSGSQAGRAGGIPPTERAAAAESSERAEAGFIFLPLAAGNGCREGGSGAPGYLVASEQSGI
jgi:hypothetical protein